MNRLSRNMIGAISEELEFVAKNSNEIDDVLEKKVRVDAHISALTERISGRVNEEAKQLVEAMSVSLSNALKGIARVTWQRFKVRIWEKEGALYGPKGPKKKIGSVGLNITYQMSPRLVGWYFPPGGIEGHRRAESLSKKVCKVYLPEDRPDSLPGWGRCLIWLDKPLTSKTTYDQLEHVTNDSAMRFFKAISKPRPSA